MSSVAEIERQCQVQREILMQQLGMREKYISLKRGDLLKLFEDGTVSPKDFEVKDRFVRMQVAKLLVKRMSNRGIAMEKLIRFATFDAKSSLDFLNSIDAVEQAEEILKWFERFSETNRQEGPPGGLALREESKASSAGPEYVRVVVRHAPTKACCLFDRSKLAFVTFAFRSDLRAIDLQEMLYCSKSFGIGMRRSKRRYVTGFLLDGARLEMSERIPSLVDGIVVDVAIGIEDIVY